MQKLGLNHGAYGGERLDIRAVLRDCAEAASMHGWTQHIFFQNDKFPWLAFHRAARKNRDHPLRIYLSAGIHGDEPAGPLAALRLLRENLWPEAAEIFLLPCLNPDGFAFNTRAGRDGTDLNRDYRQPQCDSTRAHIAWLDRQPRFHFYLSLHEDWESHGFYLYEQNPDNEESPAEKIIASVKNVCPVDPSEMIDGRPARGGIIRPTFDPAARPDWPESWYLLHTRTRRGYTLEAPSDFPLPLRIDALVTAVHAALDFSGTGKAV